MGDRASGCCCDDDEWREIYHFNELGGLTGKPFDENHPNYDLAYERLKNAVTSVSSEESFSPVEGWEDLAFNVNATEALALLFAADAVDPVSQMTGVDFEIRATHSDGDFAVGVLTTSSTFGFGTKPWYSWPVKWDASTERSTLAIFGDYQKHYDEDDYTSITIDGVSHEVCSALAHPGRTPHVSNVTYAIQISKDAHPYEMKHAYIPNERNSLGGFGEGKVWGLPVGNYGERAQLTLYTDINGFEIVENVTGYNRKWPHGSRGYVLPDRSQNPSPAPFSHGDFSFPPGIAEGTTDLPMLSWMVDGNGTTPEFVVDGYHRGKVGRIVTTGPTTTTTSDTEENFVIYDRWKLGEVSIQIAACSNRMPLGIAVKADPVIGGVNPNGRQNVDTTYTFTFGRLSPGGRMQEADEIVELDSYSVNNEVSQNAGFGGDPYTAEKKKDESVNFPVDTECFVIAGTGDIDSVNADHGVAVFYKGDSNSADQDWHCWLNGTEVSTFITRDLEKGHDDLYERAPTLAEIQTVNANPPAAKVRTNDSTRLDYEYAELWTLPLTDPINLQSRELDQVGRWYTSLCYSMAFFNRLPTSDTEAYFAVLFGEQQDIIKRIYEVGGSERIFAKTNNGDNVGGTLLKTEHLTICRNRLELYNRNGDLMKILRSEDVTELARIPADPMLGDFHPLPTGWSDTYTTGGFGSAQQGWDNVTLLPGKIHGANDRFIYFATTGVEGETQSFHRDTFGIGVPLHFAVNYNGEAHATTHTFHEDKEVCFHLGGTFCFPTSNISQPIPLDAKDQLEQ